MAKIGRNDPCPCGSGKKYKQCHGPIDAARETEQRHFKQAQDTLLAKVMDAAPRFASELGDGLQRFWNGKHSVAAIEDLDDIEERGSERFLTWFMFDYRGADGRTPAERLADDPAPLDLTPVEAEVLPTWTEVRLQPYTVIAVEKGRGFTARPLWAEREISVDDQAAARRVEEGEVLIVHLTPGGDRSYVAGAAAHLTADTAERLQEFAGLHLENLRATTPGATYDDLIRERSEIFNHFVMAVPREEQQANQLQALIDNTRVIMATTAASLGFGRPAEADERPKTLVQLSQAPEEQPDEVRIAAVEPDEDSSLRPTEITERPAHTDGH